MKKYVCFGGYVISNDGDRHYISAKRLCELYKVNSEECFLIEWDNRNSAIGIELNKYTILKPKEDGDYNLKD